MTDELVKRLLAWDGSPFDEEAHAAAARIEQLTAERDEALNQLDSSRHSIEVLQKRVAEVMAHRESWRRAFAIQSTKLQIALDAGGEPVRAALKGETP